MGQLTMVSVGPLYKLGIQPGLKPRIGARRWVWRPEILNHVPGSARRVVFSKSESELSHDLGLGPTRSRVGSQLESSGVEPLLQLGLTSKSTQVTSSQLDIPGIELHFRNPKLESCGHQSQPRRSDLNTTVLTIQAGSRYRHL